MLLDLTLRDSVAETVAVEAVVHTLRDLGPETALLDSLATVLTQILREAREREVFADDPPLVRVALRLDPPHILLRVSDTRMPVWAEGRAPRHSDALALASPLAGFHRGEQVGGGNWVECVFNLPESGERSPLDVQVPVEAPPISAETTTAVRLRELRPDDAEGLVRLIYRVYGYSYPKPEFYSPDAIRHLLTTGALSGLVAVDDTGAVVGHMAAAHDTPYLTAELGRLAVDPRYRGHGLASRLGVRLLEQARLAGTPALWGECVATHLGSQRVLIAAGGMEVGLLLAAFPGTVRMSKLPTNLQGRVSLVPIAISLSPGPLLTAHLPARLEPIYRQLMDALRLRREVDTSDRMPVGTLALRVAMLPQISVGLIAADALGSGGLPRVRAEMVAMIKAGLAPIYLDVPLADPGAAHAIDVAYRHGFIWAMLFPCARPDGDVLRLQWLGPQVVDVGAIQCATAHGVAMKAWVLGERERWMTGATERGG